MTALIRNHRDLIVALRARIAEIDVTFETAEAIAGLQSGYLAKLIGPNPIRNFGPMSFESILGALGIALVVVEDPVAIAQVQARWTSRKRPRRISSALFNVVDAGTVAQINGGCCMATKQDQVAVRIEPELREKLQAEADRERRPLGALIRNILSDAVMKPAPQQESAR